MDTDQKHSFIDITDNESRLINDQANCLYTKLLPFQINDTDIDDFGKYYFTNHHAGNRLHRRFGRADDF